MDCNTCSTCIKYKDNKEDYREDNREDNKEKKGKNIEHFSYEIPKNMCHYGCSNMNTTNIILFVLILILIYLLSRQNFLNF
jgi:hypothetical protein